MSETLVPVSPELYTQHVLLLPALPAPMSMEQAMRLGTAFLDALSTPLCISQLQQPGTKLVKQSIDHPVYKEGVVHNFH